MIKKRIQCLPRRLSGLAVCGPLLWLAGFSFSAQAQTPSGGYWQAVTNASPVAYWRLNETNGATVAADFLGFHNGTFNTAVTPGVSGPQSPAFPGFETTNTAMRLNYTTGSYLTMPTLNLNTNTVTITGWINPTGSQAGWSGIAFCRGGNTCAGLHFGPGSIANELRYTWNNSRWDKSTGLSAPAGQWSFVALVVTPTNATIYLGTNGVLNSSNDTINLPNQAFDASLLIGYDPSEGSRLFRGAIDEVAIYNHSLTPTQIQQVYTSALTLPTPAPPSGLTATPISAIRIDLAWTDSAFNEAGFLIERAPDNGGSPGTWTQFATLAANVTTFSDTNVSPNIRYWYRVRAYNAAGNSDYSNQASAIPICTPADSTIIITQPVSQVVCTGAITAAFSTAATGVSLSYQWRQNGSNLTDNATISGAATPTLTISNPGPNLSVCAIVNAANSSGTFITNVIAGQLCTYQASGCAGINSDSNAYVDPDGRNHALSNCGGAFTIFTNASPAFTCPGLVGWSLVAKIGASCIQLGTSGSFVAPASGALMLYLNDDIFGDNSGSWNVCLGSGTASNYDVVVTGTCGVQTSSVATLTIGTPPAITTPPSSQSRCQGQPVTFSVTATGGGLHYTWRKNNVPIAGAADSNSFLIASAVPADAGGYDTIVNSACGVTVTSSVATLAVSTNAPPTALVGGSATICANQSTTIQALLTGDAPWNLTWSDGVTQTNVLSSPATRTVSPPTNTIYIVTAVSNASCIGNSSGSATITVKALPTATVSGTAAVCIGNSATIQAALTGIAPWNLTWSDGFTQSGIATNPVTRTVSPTTNTIYTVTAVSDANCTGTASGSAAVTLKYPPSITGQPSNATVCVGDPVTFSVSAASTGSASVVSLRTSQPVGTSANGGILKGVGYRPDKILVKPKKGAEGLQIASQHSVIGAQVERTFARIGNLQIIKLPPGLSVEKAIEHYQRSGMVEYAEPDYELHVLLTPNDPNYLDGTLWAMNNNGQNGGTPDADIDAPEAWDTRTAANPVIVAVIDTGVRYTHEDLAANIWSNTCVSCPVNGVVYNNDYYGINAIANTGDPWDDHFHGTHVSGTIGGVGNNGKGVVGVSWNVRIMGLKFLDSSGFGSTSDAIKCINYGIVKGAKIMSNSWGGGGYDQALFDAIAAARDADIVFVAAAGNNSSNNDTTPSYPASYTLNNILAVAATDRNDLLASFSNYGATSVELGAPGVSIYSTYNTSDSAYNALSGTSMATPHVSGALALLRAQFPELNYSQAIAELLATVDPIPSLTGKTITGGRLNLQKLLTHRNPLGYQWRKNGVSIPGGTNISYTIPAVSLTDAGSYDVVVTNSCGQTISSNATLTVVNCGLLSVTPTNGLDSSGFVGGPFSPSNQTYTLQNTGSVALVWLATNTANWVSLSANGGTLASGDSTNVTVMVNSNANSLGGGSYSNTVTFTNVSNGKGTTTRGVTLAVAVPGGLTVGSGAPVCTTVAGAASSGVTFGNVVSGQNYAYQASGCVGINVGCSGPCSTVDPDGNHYGTGNCTGPITPGQTNPNFLCPLLQAHSLVGKVNGTCVQLGSNGSFVAPSSGSLLLYCNDDIYGDNSGSWNVCITVPSDLVSTGPVGGPFNPSSQIYTLSNASPNALNWTASKSANWVSLSPASGTLAVGGSTGVVVSINGNANALPAGSYSDTITFTNTTSGFGSTTRPVSLSVISGGGFFDNVENGTNGWSATGLWHIVGTGACSNSFSPTHSWYYGVNSTCTYNTGAANSGDLVSPVFVVPASGTLTFQSWEQTEDTLTTWDKRIVYITTNNSASWIQVLQSVNNASAWYQVSIDLSAYAGKVTQLRFHFETVDSVANDFRGWYIDDVRVAGPPTLSVTPATSLNASGEQGGPFLPAAQVYALSNPGNASLNWSSSVSNGWLTLSATSGSLGAGASTNVTVSINAGANALVGALYSNIVTFVNTTNGGGNANRVATLLVRDGISDAWRLQYFGHIDPRASDQSRAQDDPDGDGLSNLQEFLAGTDPTNNASAFRITSVVSTGNDVLINWMTGSGRTNALQALISTEFTTNFSDIFTVTNTLDTMTNYLDIGGATNFPSRFYRIRLVP